MGTIPNGRILSYGPSGSLLLKSVSVKTQPGLPGTEKLLYRAQQHESSEHKGHLGMNFLHFTGQTRMEGK